MSLEQTFLQRWLAPTQPLEDPKALDTQERARRVNFAPFLPVGRTAKHPCASFSAEHHRLFSLAEAHFQSPVAVCEQGLRLQ